MTFDELPLAAPLKNALKTRALVIPTPVQQAAIPAALAGKDLLACAQTGSGKTAAFVLPVLQRFFEQPGAAYAKAMRCLVLVPTRELAVQVADVFGQLGSQLGVMVQLVYGGVSQRRQVQGLEAGPEVVVATPGRLLDLLSQGLVDLRHVEFLILDEVDRMLDMGFVRDVRKIVAETPANRQTMAFSATVTKDVEDLLFRMMQKPERIMTGRVSKTAQEVDHRICRVMKASKLDLLKHLLDNVGGTMPKTLVFTATKHGADRLARKLTGLGFDAVAIHGNKSQNARERALGAFRKSGEVIMVATDVAARGLDVKGIDLVVNFDIPKEGDSYVHRVGRTARAGALGKAFTFVSEGEDSLLKGIERFIDQGITVDSSHPYHVERLPSERGQSAPARQQQRRRGSGSGESFRQASSEGGTARTPQNRRRRNRPGQGSREAQPALETKQTAGASTIPAKGKVGHKFSLSGWWRR